MTTEDLIARSRREGARRRAERDGLPLPVEPPTPRAPIAAKAAGAAVVPGFFTPGAATGTPVADGHPDAQTSPAPAPAESGPWFDRRGFFVGWLAMVLALIVFQSALAATAAGLAAAYFVSRRRRLLNAVVAVAGGYAAGTIATIVLVVVAFVVAR